VEHASNAFERALEAIRATAPDVDWSPERDRQIALIPVLERLDLELRRPNRAGLEARIHERRYLAAVVAWHWRTGNLVLSGRTGAGKTSAAAHLVRRLCADGARLGGEAFDKAQFIRWQECRTLSRVFRESKLGTGAPEDILRCQNARLLVLDDLGTRDDREALELVLDVRNKRAWPTVVTTGISTSEFVGVFGDALARRFFECGSNKGAIVDTEDGR
jgi:DNA replication protein DnaC